MKTIFFTALVLSAQAFAATTPVAQVNAEPPAPSVNQVAPTNAGGGTTGVADTSSCACAVNGNTLLTGEAGATNNNATHPTAASATQSPTNGSSQMSR